MTKAAAVVFVLVATAVLLAITGVSPAELALFALFELGFVLLPGLVAYRALARERGDFLEQVSVGAGVGHALLLAGFIVTAATGTRWVLWLLPVVALAGAGLLSRHQPKPARLDPLLSARQAIAVAGVAVAALGFMAFVFFTQAPLPGSRTSISHYPDLIWAIGIAAEALHHWPLTTPHVYGEPLRYHTFAFMDIAAVAQQTGIGLPVVSLRLWPATMLLLLVVQLCWAGRRFAGNPWAGPLAAGLVLLVGDLDLGAGRPEPLAGLYFSSLYFSASQLLGLVLFLPTIGVIADLLDVDRARARGSTLALLAILLFGCAGAKASLLAVLIGGLVVAALWRRKVTARWASVLGLCAIAFLSSYALLYSGGRRASAIEPLQSAFRSFPGHNLELEIGEHLTRAAAYPLATWVTAVALLAPLAGLTFARVSLRSPTIQQAWLLGLFAAAVGAFFMIDLPGFSQLYFLWFGYTAAALLSAAGLVDAVARWRSDRRRRGLVALGTGVAVGVVLAVGANGAGLPLVKVYMAVAAIFGAVAAASAFGVLGRMRPAVPALLAVSALLTAGLLDSPRDRLPDIASRAMAEDQAVHHEADPPRERGVTAELASGLAWVRDNTGEDAVLAVNNHFRRPAIGESRFYYYSALAERRVFVESWDYTDEVLAAAVATASNPFPERVALNDSVYTGTGGARAAARLRRRGVTHVLVDRINAPVPRNRIPGRVVFRNEALVVYRL